MSRIASTDLLLCAAPRVLEALLPDLRRTGLRIVDASGVLELDPEVPLYRGATSASPGREVAIPRGIVAGLGLALRPLHEGLRLERVTVVTLESASGAGRRGAGELSDQTVHLLSAMTGEELETEVFPRPLAFDCLPFVGDLVLASGESSEERRLVHVLRRLLDAPGLPIEATRVRVPIFGGSLACVHASFASPAPGARARELWEKVHGLEVGAEGTLPTPRSSVGRDTVLVGRLREAEGPRAGLAFVLAMDDLRAGGALAAVEAARLLLARAREPGDPATRPE